MFNLKNLFIVVTISTLLFACSSENTTEDVDTTPTPTQTTSVSDQDDPQLDYVEVIDGERGDAAAYFLNQTAYVDVDLVLSDACQKISSEVLIAESYPEQVTINITVEPDGSESCIQVITEKTETIRVGNVSRDASYKVYLNGEEL